MTLRKLYVAHVYDNDGSTPVGTLTTDRPADGSPFIKTHPTYTEQINGGQGELVLDLFCKFDDFSEGTLVAFMNVVTLDAVVIDETAKTQTTTRLYKGFVSRYEPYIEGGAEGVRVTCLGLVTLATYGLYGSTPGYAVTHTTVDPEAIGQAVVTNLNANFGGALFSYPSTTSTVGTNVTYVFTSLSHLDSLQKVKEFCPAGWWWKIDEYGYYRLGAKPTTPTHTFTIGKDVVSLTCPKDSEKVKNEVIVNGTAYSDATSQVTFGTGGTPTGRRTLLITDANITDATTRAQRGGKELADNKDQKIKATVTVNSRYPNGIESIRAGATCKIVNFKLANAFFGSQNMQVVGMSYLGDTVSLELEEHPARFGQELALFVR